MSPSGIFLYEIDSSFGPNIIAEYYLTKEKVTPDVLKEFADKHCKRDICDATASKKDLKFYSSEIDAESLKKENLFLGFVINEDEDLVALKSQFEKIEEDIVQNFTKDKKRMEILLKKNLNSFLSLLEKLEEPKIIKEAINEKTKKMLDDGKLQEARELIELGEKIPDKLSEEIKKASDYYEEGVYKKAKKYYIKAADLAEKIQEIEIVEFLRKRAENVANLPDILKTLDAMNKAIKKGLNDIEVQKTNIYEDVIPLIEKNINLAYSLEDNELAKTYEELNRICKRAARKAEEMNNLDKGIIKLLEEI
jgi:tetratricopeptide (TPR) repeat protein